MEVSYGSCGTLHPPHVDRRTVSALAVATMTQSGKFGIAVISPPLDDAGNSIRAQRAITEISNALGGNPYAPKK